MAGRVLMRVFLVAALALAAYFGVPLALRHHHALRQAAVEATERLAGQSAPASSPSQRSVQPEPEGEETAGPPRTYYRYIDGGGTLRFVESLEAVPEPFRASAKPLGMGTGGGDDAPSLTRAQASRPKRRPYGRAPQPPAARAGDYDPNAE
jgi:hypothetical protein